MAVVSFLGGRGWRCSQVEDLIIVLDKVAPVAGVARADGGESRGTEVDGIDVVRAGNVPGRVPDGVGGARVEEAGVTRLYLPDQCSLGSRRARDGSELRQ